MPSIHNRSNQLLKNVIFTLIAKSDTFTHIKSVMNDAWYNYIVPSAPSNRLNWPQANKIIKEEGKKNYALSYYVPEKLRKDYEQYFTEHHHETFGTDFYMLISNKKYENSPGGMVELNEKNLEEFVRMDKICFPDWDNTEHYARHFWKLQQNPPDRTVKNYLYYVDGQAVGFGAIVASAKLKLAYIHNTGVLPEHRRRGHFTNMTKHLINFAIQYDTTESYALVEENGASYHGFTKMGFHPAAKFYLFDTKPK